MQRADFDIGGGSSNNFAKFITYANSATSNTANVMADIIKIGTSTIQSRATAAIINNTYVFSLPGSPGACKDGWDRILKYQLDIRHKPCNFIEIMPRLKEK